MAEDKNKALSPEEEEYLVQQEAMIAEAQRQQGGYSQAYSTAMFANHQKQNLVEWQLDFSKELIEIERLLRSDILMRDKNGVEYWIPNPNKARVLFNEQGVQDLLRDIFTLVNKNKVLSNYSLDEISRRVRQIKHEIRVKIYNNYEIYGMDNEYKMNNYSMVVLSIGSLIEDAYRRALNGEERKDLNQARVVNQNEPMMPQSFNFYPGGLSGQKKGFLSKLNPLNWGSS